MSRRNASGSRRLFAMVGAGGMGRDIMTFALPQFQRKGIECCFVDKTVGLPPWQAAPTLTVDEFFAQHADEYLFNVSVADSLVRARLVEEMSSRGGVLTSVVHENAFIGLGVDVGPGAVICAFSALTADCSVGQNFQCNIYSYVTHDCVIGDNVTLAPRAHINGNVHVHDHAYIGTGAMIRQGTPTEPLIIGEGAVVGMGAVVTKDVPPHTTVVGNPAKPLIKR